MKLDSIPVGTGAHAVVIPPASENRSFDLRHAGSSQRPPSAHLNDFPPHVPQPDEGTTGQDSNDAMDDASEDERDDSCKTITHPHRTDAGDACGQAECQRRTRRAWWTFPRVPKQPGRGSGRHFGSRKKKERHACAQGISQSAQRGGNENFRLPPFQQDRRTTGINIALSNWR